jgi:DNA-binding MarR family transcriptional regulator
VNLELDFSRPPARAHRDDPVTSRQAAARVNTSGKAKAQREQVYGLIVQSPGRTTAELAEIHGVDRAMVARRCPELRERGLVENREPRICRVNQTMALEWWAK